MKLIGLRRDTRPPTGPSPPFYPPSTGIFKPVRPHFALLSRQQTKAFLSYVRPRQLETSRYPFVVWWVLTLTSPFTFIRQSGGRGKLVECCCWHELCASAHAKGLYFTWRGVTPSINQALSFNPSLQAVWSNIIHF